ncbi:MAG: type II secretion system F family protein [Thermoanaerobaculia bacterium]
MSVEFVCRLGTPAGDVVSQVRRADDETSLRRELMRAGYHIFELKPRNLLARFRLPVSGAARQSVPMRPFLIFNQELAALLRAGLPLLQGLDLLHERVREPVLKRALADIRDRVRAGEDLSDAVAAQGDVFPALYPATLKAGERTGELEQVVRRFIRYQRLVLDARKKTVSALIYPAVLIGLSMALVAVMAIFVMPRFQSFYDALDAELPVLTRITLGVSQTLQRFWPVLLGLIVVGGWLTLRFKRTQRGRLLLAGIGLRLPLIGGIFRRLAIAEFSRSAATLLIGGMPLPQSLAIAVSSVSNARVREQLAPVVRRVEEGRALNEAVSDIPTFDPLAVDMIKVGESTGSLGAMLSEVADFLDEEVETFLQRILGLLEPLMLVIMGIVVALLLISVYLPLFSVLQQIR